MKRAFQLLILLIMITAVAGGWGYHYYTSSLKPVEPGDKILVTVPPGSSTKKIAAILYSNGLIRNAKTFAFYVERKGKGSMLQAGTYQITQGQTVEQIIDKMAKGEIYVETVHFTIPEGFTVAQIAELLGQKGIVDQEVFLRRLNRGTSNMISSKRFRRERKLPDWKGICSQKRMK
jgi:UPF0755 protein